MTDSGSAEVQRIALRNAHCRYSALRYAHCRSTEIVRLRSEALKSAQAAVQLRFEDLWAAQDNQRRLQRQCLEAFVLQQRLFATTTPSTMVHTSPEGVQIMISMSRHNGPVPETPRHPVSSRAFTGEPNSDPIVGPPPEGRSRYHRQTGTAPRSAVSRSRSRPNRRTLVSNKRCTVCNKRCTACTAYMCLQMQ